PRPSSSRRWPCCSVSWCGESMWRDYRCSAGWCAEQILEWQRKAGDYVFTLEHTVGREYPGRAIGVAHGYPSFPRVHEPHQANPAGEILAHFFLDLGPAVPRRKDLDGEIRRTEDELLGNSVGR